MYDDRKQSGLMYSESYKTPTCLGDFEGVLITILWPHVCFLAFCLQAALRGKVKKIEAKMEYSEEANADLEL